MLGISNPSRFSYSYHAMALYVALPTADCSLLLATTRNNKPNNLGRYEYVLLGGSLSPPRNDIGSAAA